MHSSSCAIHAVSGLALLRSPESGSEGKAECHLRQCTSNNAMHARSNVCDVSTVEQKENVTEHSPLRYATDT